MSHIFLRADGNKQIGLGHLTRTLALAEMLGPEECTFLIHQPSETVKQMVSTVCRSIRELDETSLKEEAVFIRDHILKQNDVLVLDGYQFDTEYQQSIKQNGSILVCIDDFHKGHFTANLIINHAAGLSPELYSAEPYTKFALGPDFALLRNVFQQRAKESRQIKSVKTAFTCFGGSDPWNGTLMALKTLLELEELKRIHVVVGPSYEHMAGLEEYVNKNSMSQVKLHHSLDAGAMSALMSESEISICPASTVAYELIACKSGMVLELMIENQQNIYNGLLNSDVALAGVDKENMDVKQLLPLLQQLMDPEIVNEMMLKQSKLIDGKAAERLRKLFGELRIIHTLD